MATYRFVSWGMIPVGGLACGLVASGLGARDTLLLLAAVTAMSPLILVASPVRRLRDLTDYPAS
jgi:hypothetical protein